MTNEEIKELLQIFNESGVGELELQRGRDRLRIRRAGDFAASVSHVQTHSAAPAPEPAPAPAVAPAAKIPDPDSNHVLVKSPIVGTFYEGSSPGVPAFVKVGDSVEVGQVLCIIESMKLMNEIEAEVAGVIAAKLVENGRPVEYGEPLFAILPR
ncbi:MAG TPA: acetyl-CoA carboxylase biotin carboxyl carrier protein [Bryobacteraceae bacterium]|jgi:acetyl-CoA carboxylase biotin carboxyl carrier protein